MPFPDLPSLPGALPGSHVFEELVRLQPGLTHTRRPRYTSVRLHIRVRIA